MADATCFLGTWNMTSWKEEFVATGEKIDALGPDPVGYINYGPDGRFYAGRQLGCARRPEAFKAVTSCEHGHFC